MIINIYLLGGLLYFDLWDFKFDVLVEICGEFCLIWINVLGIEICELFL